LLAVELWCNDTRRGLHELGDTAVGSIDRIVGTGHLLPQRWTTGAGNRLAGLLQLLICSLYLLSLRTLQSTDRPSRIIYSIDNASGLHALIRRQEFIDQDVPPPPLLSLLACHVLKFDLKRLKDRSENAQVPDQEEVSPTKPVSVPKRMRLRIEFDDSSPPIDRVLCGQSHPLAVGIGRRGRPTILIWD